MKIVIADDYEHAVRQLDCYPKLAGHEVTIYHDIMKDPAVLVERFKGADVLVLIRERTRITPALLEQLPKLKLISQTGKGTAHIDLASCTARGVAVASGGGSPYAPAEITWALVLAATRHLPQAVTQLKAGQWQSTLGVGLYGRTLGIYGYGKIGSVVANYGRAFGMKVMVWGRDGSLERARQDGYETTADSRELFSTSDVLSLHIKLVKETRSIVTAADLAQMKPTALLVNTSRAELIESGALVQALQAGRPGFAAVDVYEEEPATNNPLLRLNNALCTPHIGYVEKDAYEMYFDLAFDQLLAFAAGNPINIVNPESLTKH